MTETPPPPSPERFVDDQHRYRLESRIATGGMGEVWRATDTSLGRPVAVKVLKSEYADDPLFRSRFEEEARHAASLHHPGVASVYDVGESALLGAADGSGVPRPFLVMELVEGQPLSALLRGGRPLDPEVVRDLMAQTADGLGAAHRAGIVHRDVKPANLIVTPDRKVKITDFGIARASDGLGLTGTGQVMGTPQYLSPEQARGSIATSASDVYSLGVVAFECLVGHRPFDAESPVATALAHLNDPVPALPAGVPADLAAVVRRALSKDPADRFADGAAFAVALRDPARAVATMAGAEQTQVLAPVPPRPAPVPAPLPTPLRDAVHGDERDGLHNPWPWLLAFVVAVVLIIVVVIAATGGKGNDDPSSEGGVTDTPSTTPSTSASTPTEESSSAPAAIEINAGDYVGRNVDDVAGELKALGLKVKLNPVDNPGGQDTDSVKAVHPTTNLVKGSTVTVDYYREAEPTSEPPSTEPTSQPPSDTSTPTPSDTGTPTSPDSTASQSQPSETPTTSDTAAPRSASRGAP